MGLLCLPVGVAVGWWITHDAGSEGWSLFPLYAGLAAFLAPALIWRLMMKSSSRGRAALAGTLGALAAHYLAFYAQIVGLNIDYWLLGAAGSALGEPPIDPLNGLWGALPFTLFSVPVIGWLTLPAGALIE